MAIDILNAVEKIIGKFIENNESALEGKDEIVGVLGNAVVRILKLTCFQILFTLLKI